MPASFQTWATATRPSSMREIIRVSTRTPFRLNSFQARVPTGNSHWSGSVASIVVPAGSCNQRRLSAPSLQSAKREV